MKLVAYLRVSTDDKGQDPERQKIPILQRAARDSHEVVAWVTDEGTSGAVPPLDREKVQEALRLARELGAGGIIVEAVDRWTRGGFQDLGVSLFLLQTDHQGIKLLVADMNGDDDQVEFLLPLMAYVARETRKRLIAATKSGMARRKAQGAVFGRPRKPDLTDEEAAICYELLKAGKGFRSCELAVSRMRGAFELADAKARRERSVGRMWIRDQLAARPQTPGLLGRVLTPGHTRPAPKGTLKGHPRKTGGHEAHAPELVAA